MARVDTRAIERELDRIRSLDVEELRGEWQRLYHSERAKDQPRPPCPRTRLQTSGNRTWRAWQVDLPQAANGSEGPAEDRSGWTLAKPQLEAGRAPRS